MPDDEPESHLSEPALTDAVQQLYDADLADGFVMNLTRVWAHEPAAIGTIRSLMDLSATAAGLDFRQRGVLIAALASTMGDSYCSIAWGSRLAGATDGEVAAGVLQGDDSGLVAADRALATWARRVASDPNSTGSDDVQALRDAGFDDRQIFGITLFVATRLAFSTVNDALGARPDRELYDAAPAEVREVVTYGRRVG
jgi:alkylhydroperoxidase family enzyme